MEYRKLSELVAQLTNPQRSDIFVRAFRSAVRDGEFDAADLSERVDYPKIYARRGGEGGNYSKSYKDMIFQPSKAIDRWFDNINEELNKNKRQRRSKPNFEGYVTGEHNYEEAVAKTRERMLSSKAKGEKLGSSRSTRPSAAKKASRPAKSKS